MATLSWSNAAPRAMTARFNDRELPALLLPGLLAATLAVTAAAVVAARFVPASVTLSPAPPASTQPLGKPVVGSGPIGNSSDPIDVQSEQAEHSQQARVTIYSGNVVAVQGLARLRTPKLTVYVAPPDPDALKSPTGAAQGEAGRIERMEAEGPVNYTTPTERAIGDHGAYVASSDTITLTGNVVLVQGRNVGTGDKLVIDKRTGHYSLTSNASLGPSHRVRSILYPAQPGASPNGAKPTGQTGAPVEAPKASGAP